jgi:hypothetical protein
MNNVYFNFTVLNCIPTADNKFGAVRGCMELEKHLLNYSASQNTILAGGVYLPLGRPINMPGCRTF